MTLGGGTGRVSSGFRSSDRSLANVRPRSILAYVSFTVLTVSTLQPDTRRLARALAAPQATVEVLTTIAQYGALVVLLLCCAPRNLASTKYLLAFYLSLGVSVLWSIDKAASLRFTVLGVATCLVVAGVAKALSVNGLVKAGVGVLSLSMVLSLLAYRDFRYSIPTGIFTTRNELARYAVYAVAYAIFLWLWVSRTAWRVVALGCAGLGVYVIVSAGSATSILVVVALISMLLIQQLLRFVSLPTLAIVFSTLLAGLVASFPWLSSEVLGALGKDDTLTGRTTIWSLAWAYIGERPFGGYGVAAFWDSEPGDAVRDVFGPYAVNAHNAWLDLFLSAGLLLGVLALVLFWAQVLSPLRSSRQVPARGQLAVLLTCMMALMTLVYSNVEAAVYRPMYGLTLLTLSLLVKLGNRLEEAHPRGGDTEDRSGRQPVPGSSSDAVGI